MSEKKVNKAWLPVAIILGILALGFMVHDSLEAPVEVLPEGYVSIEEANASLGNLNTAKDTEIASLNEQLAEAEKPVEVVYTDGTPVVVDENGDMVVEEEKSFLGYLIDKLKLGIGIPEETYSDREVITLFDGEVSFDGEDYDTNEFLILSEGIVLEANGDDFEGNVYMTVQSEAVEYKLTFEDDLITSNIGEGEYEDETLEFMFLGENYEVTKWNDASGKYEITLNKGTEQKLTIGESIDVDGSSIVLDAIADDKIFVCVDGVCKSISEDQTKTVNGIEISVNSVFNSETYQFAYLTVGDEVELTITHDEEYEKDSAWKYVITEHSIGIILDEDFDEVDLDGDEEFQAIGVGESLSLPNAYLGIIFNGMSSEDVEEYDFEIDGDFVEIKGNFEVEHKDYNRIYVNDDGLIYEDDNLDDKIVGEFKLGNSDLVLSANETHILIVDSETSKELIQLNLDLKDMQVDDSKDITNDEDYLTNYGILVMNPDDSIEDEEWTIEVPEKQLEGSISLI